MLEGEAAEVLAAIPQEVVVVEGWAGETIYLLLQETLIPSLLVTGVLGAITLAEPILDLRGRQVISFLPQQSLEAVVAAGQEF